MTARSLRRTAAAALAAAAGLVATAAPTGTSLAVGPFGGVADGSVGAPLPLGPGRFLFSTAGADLALGSADDATILVSGAGNGATPFFTPLPTPGLSGYSGHMTRLSGTRALLLGEGVDGTWKTADDVVLLLDELGSANTVTPIVVGYLDARDVNAPVALGSDAAVCTTLGADGTAGNGDDQVAILSDIGGANTVTLLSAPFLAAQAGSRPTALGTDSFLLGSLGPDGTVRTVDDLVYLFTSAFEASPVRTDIVTPRRAQRGPGQFVVLGPTSAVAVGAGADAAESTADDELLLLTGLGGTNTLTPIVVGFVFDYGGGRPTPLSATTVVFAGCGPDGSDVTADDRLTVVTGLGTTNTITHVTTGALDEDGQTRPVALDAATVASTGSGVDGTRGNADDDLLVLEDVGGANTLRRFPIGGALAGGITSEIVPLGERAVLVSSIGPDGTTGTGDEFVAQVTWDDGTFLVQTDALGGGRFSQEYGDEYVAAPLGRGMAVLGTAGVDGTHGNADDSLRLLEDLPDERFLRVKNMKIGFKVAKPEKGASVSLKATLHVPGLDVFGSRAVTVTLGNASQTISGLGFEANKGGVVQYKDPKGLSGFVRKIVWNPRNGSLVLKAKGVGTGIEGTDPLRMLVSLEGDDAPLADAFPATAFKGGIKYKAPKQPE
jgi:hypothetical protein